MSASMHHITNPNSNPITLTIKHPMTSVTRFLDGSRANKTYRRNASINVKPEGGTPGKCGAFDLYCLRHPREFD